MKKLIIILVLVSSLLVFTSLSYALEPKFKLHVISCEGQESVNYSVNMPVVLDYDGDGDLDIAILGKNSKLYIWENITNN